MTAVDHDHASRLVTHLSQQRSSGKYCDVCVCVAEQRFLAHKCVLSANSDQLDALILDATDEDNASHDIEIEIHGVSPVGFEIVLEYFYTGVLRLEPTTVTHTWMTAVYLGLPDIINRCNSYCQQSVCVTAHPKASTVSSVAFTPANPQTSAASMLADNGNANSSRDATTNGNPTQAQLTTSTVLSSAINQPKVNSAIKTKENANARNPASAGKDMKPQPLEIRENQGTDRTELEGASKKAKLETTDGSAIEWSPYSQNAVAVTQPGVNIPVTSMPQVVVNFVQGYGTYQPVEWGPAGQQWAQLQVGTKGQLVTGVIPIASQQVKSEPAQAASAVQIIGAEPHQGNAAEVAAPAGASSPVSYTTLSLVSQGSESRNDGDTSSAETATPVLATPAPSADPHAGQAVQIAIPAAGNVVGRPQNTIQTQELNLDSIHFTQVNSDNGEQRLSTTQSPSTTTTFIQPITMINNLPIANPDGSKCDTMIMQSQVEQLRIQHQQLQRLRQLETGENGEIPLTTDAAKAVLATSKRKRKAPTRVAKSEDGTGNVHEMHAHNNVRKTKSLADSVLVTITNDHMENLYKKYPEIKKEPAVGGTCDVMQLLQHGKARQRKSSEQNALNNTIRTILDTTGIVESGDSRVQDAVCLIMDRFTVLQEHMNDAYVRKQLTIKVKHSIHCKKWRLKRHKMKQMEMNSASSPDARSQWVTTKTSISSVGGSTELSSASSPDVAATWITDPNMNNSSLSSNNSIIAEDGLHS